MRPQRLKAYLTLIQELLTCPSGEEWIRLRQHEDLVDTGLVQTMEQVATTLAQEGKREEAIFLHNWAGQLHHIVAQATRETPQDELADAYLEFIQALLAATPEEQQRLIAANQPLVNPRLVHLMRQVSAQLAARGDRDTANYLNRLAEQLGQLWQQQHEFARPTTPQPAAMAAQPQPAPLKTAPPKPGTIAREQPVESAGNGDRTTPTQVPPVPPLSAPPLHLPDPWLESVIADKEAAMASDAAISESVPTPSAAVASPPAAAAPAATLERIESHLAAIAASLTQLGEQLTHAVNPPNPIWHLDALEQAYQAGWVLTTEELEALLHVHPKCSADETVFARGGWRFVKVGKVGMQMGWRVEKTEAAAQ